MRGDHGQLRLLALQIGVNWRPDLFAPAKLLLFAAILDESQRRERHEIDLAPHAREPVIAFRSHSASIGGKIELRRSLRRSLRRLLPEFEDAIAGRHEHQPHDDERDERVGDGRPLAGVPGVLAAVVDGDYLHHR